MDRYKIIKRAGRKSLLIRWFDGLRWREKSSGTSRRREAERIAKELIASAPDGPVNDWLTMRMEFMATHMVTQSRRYRSTFMSATKKFEDLCNPQRCSDVTPAMLGTYRSKLLKEKLSVSTVATYLKHLRTALNWAERHGYLSAKVRVEMPRQSGGGKMKGRPLSGEEFERILATARKVLGEHAQPLVDFMMGLWLSGLRLGEGLLLSWDNPSELLITSIDGRRPMVEIPAAIDKGRQHRTLPLTPDFVAFLRALPSRKGRVFRPLSVHGRPLKTPDSIGRLISELGATAKVSIAPGKHATAHDFRRSFGSRWAMRVTPAVLQELMRHADIKTTLTYYVGQSAERTANEVWDAFRTGEGVTLGGSATKAKSRQST